MFGDSTPRFAAVGAALAIIVAGCSGAPSPAQATASSPATSGAPPESSASVAPLSGSITVWSWDVAAAALKRMAADFQAANPGTTVDVQDVGYDNAYDKI